MISSRRRFCQCQVGVTRAFSRVIQLRASSHTYAASSAPNHGSLLHGWSPPTAATCRSSWSWSRTLTTVTSSGNSENNSKSPILFSVYDPSSDNWQDWFPPEEYNNPWDPHTNVDCQDSKWLQEQVEPIALDRMTRHTLQLLRDLYQGTTPIRDRITTERCNVVLKYLKEKPNLVRAHRARAILKRMELFYDLDPPTSNNRIQSYSDKPLILYPKPSRRSYRLVLKLCSAIGRTTTGSLDDDLPPTREVPLLCREIVQSMPMQVTMYEYGYMMDAWANTDDPQKCMECYQILQEMKDKSLNLQSAYRQVLFVCAKTFQQAWVMKDTSSQYRATLIMASNVAQRVWNEVILNGKTRVTPRMFSFYLSTCRENAQRLEEGFRLCCQRGMVNPFIVGGVLKIAFPEMRLRLFGPFWRPKNDEDPSLLPKGVVNPNDLFRCLPEEWSRHAEQASTLETDHDEDQDDDEERI